MAILDNSGDIILDAVLTDRGRQLLSEQTRNPSATSLITKFALGDDEINYASYDRTHASGSAYYDLEILQTPVFQALTQTNANINYGLLDLTNNALLYLPVMVLNQKATSGITTENIRILDGVITVAVDTDSYNAIANTDTGYALGEKYVLLAGAGTGRGAVIETGLNTTDIKGDHTTRSQYLSTAGSSLLDDNFAIYGDQRFISDVLASNVAGTFTNDNAGTPDIQFSTMIGAGAIGTALQLDYYNTWTAKTMPDMVWYSPNSNIADTSISAISGPRGMVQKFNWDVNPALKTAESAGRSADWAKYGAINQTSMYTGGTTANSYDYIDSTVYIVGMNTGVTLQVTLRIIRLAASA